MSPNPLAWVAGGVGRGSGRGRIGRAVQHRWAYQGKPRQSSMREGYRPIAGFMYTGSWPWHAASCRAQQQQTLPQLPGLPRTPACTPYLHRHTQTLASPRAMCRCPPLPAAPACSWSASAPTPPGPPCAAPQNHPRGLLHPAQHAQHGMVSTKCWLQRHKADLAAACMPGCAGVHQLRIRCSVHRMACQAQCWRGGGEGRRPRPHANIAALPPPWRRPPCQPSERTPAAAVTLKNAEHGGVADFPGPLALAAALALAPGQVAARRRRLQRGR